MGAESSRAIIESDGTILDVHGQHLGEVDKKLLGKFPGLLQLNLSENGLKFLPADITKLQKLEKLLCSNNELADLPHSANLPSLKELDLSFNRLRHVPQEIREFTQLRVLRLASNMIVELPPLRLPKLVSLSLANNALPLLPAASLSLLTSLTNLNVERNQFSFWPVPEGLVLSNLQSFNCSYNGIYVLPMDFEQAFLQLTELRLAAANINALPASLSRLTKLTSLDVSSNALSTLAHVLTLSNLEKLQVNANRLASLDGIGVLASLNRLEAAANKLTALPADMTSLRNLESLQLGSNELTTLPEGLFAATPRLTELVLSRNALTSLPDEISRLKLLEILDVANNKLGLLPTAIVTMPSLKSLIYDGKEKPYHLQPAPSRKLLRSTSSNTVASSVISKEKSIPPPSSEAHPGLDLSHSQSTRVRASTSQQVDAARSQSHVRESSKTPDSSPSPSKARRKDKERFMKQQSSSTPLVPSMPSVAAVPTTTVPLASAPNVNTELKTEGSSSNSFIFIPPLAVSARKRDKESTEANGDKKQQTEKEKPKASEKDKESENIPKAMSSSSDSEKKHLKNSGALNLSASVAALDSASVIDVRRLRMYLSEGKRIWLDEFKTANGLQRLVEVAEQALKDQSGKKTPLLTEADLSQIPRIFIVLCLALEPPIDETTSAALIPRTQLAALRLLGDITREISNPQPLLDGLQELQAKFKLASRFQGLARTLSTGNPSAELRTAGLTLINALLATPDDVEQRSKLRAEIEASGVKSLLVLWKGLSDSSMKLQLRNYAEAVEFDETTAASARSIHMSPRATPDANLRVLLVPLQKTITVPLDKELSLGALRAMASGLGLEDASEYALFVPSESAWLREESCLLSAFIERPERVELRLLPWSFKLSVGLAASGTAPEDITIDVDPHLTCAQLLASLIKRFGLPSDAEYELLFMEDSDKRTPLDPTEAMLRYKALKGREGKLILKKMRKDLRIELPPSARSGSHIRRVSGNASIKDQLASLASQGFLPGADVALFRESSGDWVNADALDDLESSDVLRVTAKPREVTIAIPPTGKKVALNVAITEQPTTVINRLVSRYFGKDTAIASTLVLMNTTLGIPLIEGKSLREQGFEPTHELAAIEKEKTEPPAATRVPSGLSEEPANVLHPPEAGEVVMKGTELQAASLNALLRYLTEDVATATQEGPAFLLCFRTVIPAFAVLSRLLERYRGVTAATPSNAEKTRVRDAVAALVAFWVESYPEDFTDQALLRMLTDLSRLVEREPTSPGATAQLQEACAIAMTGSKAHRRLGQRTPLNSADFAAKAAKMHSHASASAAVCSRLLDADSSQVARQLSRLDSLDYRRVRPLELLHQAWNGEKREKTAPHLAALISRFNYFAGMVTEAVLLQPKLRHRVKAVSYMIKTAVALRELNNYWSLMAVISGLSHSAVTRLRWTLKKLPHSVAQDFEQLKALMNPSDNWRPYRTAIAATKPPCIPYFGVNFQDLVFIDDGNPDKIRQPKGPSLINFSKQKQTYASVSALRQFQSVAYDIEEEDEVSPLVTVPVTLMTEEQLYAMSLEREPRNADISDVQ